jgi:hypothetical protein
MKRFHFLLAFLAYAALAVAITYPLIWQLTRASRTISRIRC